MSVNDSIGWDDLSQAYHERGLVLALGAGVSSGSGLPTSVDLFKSVATRVEQQPELVDQLFARNYTFEAIASILHSCSPDPAEFVEHVRAALYAGFPKQWRDVVRAQPCWF